MWGLALRDASVSRPDTGSEKDSEPTKLPPTILAMVSDSEITAFSSLRVSRLANRMMAKITDTVLVVVTPRTTFHFNGILVVCIISSSELGYILLARYNREDAFKPAASRRF